MFITLPLQGENDEPDHMSENMRENRIGEDDLSNTDDNITGIPISHFNDKMQMQLLSIYTIIIADKW